MNDQNTIQCPQCGQLHPASLVYCPNTGRPIRPAQAPPPPVFPAGAPPGYGQQPGTTPDYRQPGTPPGYGPGQAPPPPVFPGGAPPGYGQQPGTSPDYRQPGTPPGYGPGQTPPPPVFPGGASSGYGQQPGTTPDYRQPGSIPGYGQTPPPPGYDQSLFPPPPPAARRGVPPLVWALAAMVVIGIAGYIILGAIGGFTKKAEGITLPTFQIPTLNIPTLAPLPTLSLPTLSQPTFAIPSLPPIPTFELFPTSAGQSTRTPSATPWPSRTPSPTPIVPRAYDFKACAAPCKGDGSNAVATFPEKSTTIYLQWRYDNLPAGAHYVRRWSLDGNEWVRYDCTWPGPSSGVDDVTLTEPNGLASGTWIISILVDGTEILHDFVRISGSWSYWDPAGTFNSCYGKK